MNYYIGSSRHTPLLRRSHDILVSDTGNAPFVDGADTIPNLAVPCRPCLRISAGLALSMRSSARASLWRIGRSITSLVTSSSALRMSNGRNASARGQAR